MRIRRRSMTGGLCTSPRQGLWIIRLPTTTMRAASLLRMATRKSRSGDHRPFSRTVSQAPGRMRLLIEPTPLGYTTGRPTSPCDGTSGLRARLKSEWGPAARDFGTGRGGETRASPQRAVRVEPTKASAKRPAARRVFEQRAGSLRCSSVRDHWRVSSLLAPRDPALSSKTGSPLTFQTGSQWGRGTGFIS